MLYFWQEVYRDAMLELDPKKLADKIDHTEVALSERQKILVGAADGGVERIAISDALASLKFLRREALQHPVE